MINKNTENTTHARKQRQPKQTNELARVPAGIQTVAIFAVALLQQQNSAAVLVIKRFIVAFD